MCRVVCNTSLGKNGKLVSEEHFAADPYDLHVLGKRYDKHEWYLEWSICFTSESEQME